jgi:Type IV secretory system Conjugative DNA transfer
MEQIGFAPEKKFANPQEELAFLREQIALKDRELRERGENPLHERVVVESLEKYRDTPTHQVLQETYRVPSPELQSKAEAITLNLSPETHDDKMSELLALVLEKGVKNTLDVVERINSPHIEDDFHRFLVQYLKGGYPAKGLPEKEPIARALKMTLYEIALPEADDEEAKRKTLKEVLSSMEQLYMGMFSVGGEDHEKTPEVHYITLELAVANHSDEFIFYIAVPDSKRSLLEKQVLSIFHNARITEKTDDYNIFNEQGASVGATARLSRHSVFPIKTYEQFDHDPLNIILNSFSKIQKDGEGAAVQIVFRPGNEAYMKEYKGILERLQKGVSAKDVESPKSFFGALGTIGKEFINGSVDAKIDEKKKKGQEVIVDQLALEQVKNKISSPIVETNIRLIASAESEMKAKSILSDLESAFFQFENAQGNKLVWDAIAPRAFIDFARDVSFRLFHEDTVVPLSIREITSIFHLPAVSMRATPQLKIARASSAPAPLDMPKEGIVLGTNNHQGTKTPVHMLPEDRLRHFYVVGQTGTGKTSLLKNMIIQDIEAGEGVCMIDPHGSDIQDILSKVPAHRAADVIYFDPAHVERPMGLNMLEYDTRYPEQKIFVVNELFGIFQKLYGAVPESMGPMFEQYFRNATMLVIEDPETGNTLLDVSRVMSNKAYRELKLSRCKNPIVVQFWKEIAEKAGGEASLANIVPYVTSKFDVFLANEIMRPIVAQEKSAFNFRDIMDKKKILLVNLSKGRLGDINANLIGLIFVGKILMAALSRVDALGTALPPFYLYIDEFQNITTNSISTILSEARKYKLGLTVAHQFIAQLEQKTRDAVFGNVGSIASFRVSAEDAEYLEKQFAPVFSARDIMNIDNFNAYIKMLVNGRPVRPFNIELEKPTPVRTEHLENLKQLSYLTYGRDRAVVEAEIMRKYQK